MSSIRIWDFLTEDCICEFVAPHSECTNVSFSANKNRLATVGIDNKKR